MSQNNENHLSLISVSIGIIGAALISASSFYAVLKFDSLYLPVVAIAFLSIFFLKMAGKKSNGEFVISYTIMGAGFTVAVAVAFTMPGFLVLGGTLANINKTLFLITMILGSFIGTILSFILRNYFIEKEKLDFPFGEASNILLQANGDEKKSKILTYGILISSIVSFFRDSLFSKRKNSVIPETFYLRNNFWNFNISPLFLGLGYMIGFINTFSWFLGGLVTLLIARPLVVYYRYNASYFSTMKFNFVIGFFIGAGCSMFIKMISTYKKENENSPGEMPNTLILLLIFTFFSVWIVSYFYRLPVFLTAIFIMICILCAFTSGVASGKTGISPTEVYGVTVIIVITFFNQLLGGIRISPSQFLTRLNVITIFFLVCITGIVCGLTGNLLTNFKVGSKINILPWQQFVAELIGAVTSSFIIWILFFIFFGAHKHLRLRSSNELVLLYQQVTAGYIRSFPYPHLFWIGGIVGFAFNILKFPVFYIGVGIYIPFDITLTVFAGGVIHLICKKISNKFFDSSKILFSGMMVGEILIKTLFIILNYLRIFI